MTTSKERGTPMKKAIVLMIALIMLMALSACKVVPDVAFAVDNDTERIVEQATDEDTGTKVSNVEIPEINYTFTTSAVDGNLTVNVDAPVIVPESQVPMAKVSETGFTQEQVTTVFYYLFPDEKPSTGLNVPGVLTKTEIKDLIAMYEKWIDEGTLEQNSLYTNEEIGDEIASLEKQYETAPEEEPELDAEVSDGTMTLELTGGDKYAGEEILELDAQTDDYRIAVTVPVDENGYRENYFSFGSKDGHWFSDLNAVKIDENNWSAAAQGKLTTTYEDAKAICDGFFDALNISDVALCDAFIIDDEQTEEGHAREAQNYAYQFNYVRTVNGFPVANMSYLSSVGDDNRYPWMYEYIMFRVSDNGIEDICWHAHTTTGEIINDDTGVIDFDEAKEIFETMVVTKYGDSEQWQIGLDKVNVDIDEVALSLVRVREQDEIERNGIYMPAWVFYGNVKREYKDCEFVNYGWELGNGYPFTKYPVLVINAIDGSIIDPVRGY